MAACWRSLHQLPDVDVFVVAFQARTQTAFADNLMAGIPCRLLDAQEQQNQALIQQTVREQQPDIVVLCGWLHPPYCKLTTLKALKHTKFIMGMDTPWWGTWKQQLAPLLLRSYLRKIDRVVVTGERSWQYARRLGISTDRIMRGLYGIDYDTWSSLLEKRQQSPWPRSFLFVGRYATVKAIDVLVSAYQEYRTQVSDPWSLTCCGKGDLDRLLVNQAGIKNLGFVQPTDMPTIWQNAGAFIMPSRFDPWPLAIVEAAAAGLPIVCTEVCGSSVEVVRPWYNGLPIADNNISALTAALINIHNCYGDLPVWGARSQQLAAPYSTKAWVKRWRHLLYEVSGNSPDYDAMPTKDLAMSILSR